MTTVINIILILLSGLGWILVVLGVIMIIWIGRFMFIAKASRNWPTVLGVILESKFTEQQTAKGPLYQVRIKYKYQVEAEYISDCVAFGMKGSVLHSFQQANDLISRYPEGTQVQVYYHPKKPKIAALEKGNTDLAFGGVVGGVITILMGIGFMKVGPFILKLIREY